MLERLLNADEGAALLGLHKRTLERWRREGIGPAFLRFGPKIIRYRRSALEAFMEESERTNTAGGRPVRGG